MAVRNSRSAASDHRRHDRLLVARFATGDAEFGQEREAKELIRHCNECAELAADIGAISKSVAKLPAARRTRDFRLTPEQADKLRGSALERFFRTISGSGWTVVRPVAGVALSIGLVMSVVGVLPILGAGGLAAAPAAAPTDDFIAAPVPGVSSGGVETASDDPARNVDAGNAEIADNTLNHAYVTASTSPSAVGMPAQDGARYEQPRAMDSRDLLFIGGLVVTVLALAVLGLLYAVRRRFTDPLLR